LRQNPQFYLDLPTSFGADFVKDATKDFRFKRNDTVYVLVDKPDLGRIYLEAENGKRMFGNVWKPNDVLIFKGEPNVTPSKRPLIIFCRYSWEVRRRTTRWK
jgi:hypothetical protein